MNMQLSFYQGIDQKRLAKNKRPIFRVGRILCQEGFPHFMTNLLNNKWAAIHFRNKFYGNCHVVCDVRNDRTSVLRVSCEGGLVWEFKNFRSGIDFILGGMCNQENYIVYKCYDVTPKDK